MFILIIYNKVHGFLQLQPDALKYIFIYRFMMNKMETNVIFIADVYYKEPIILLCEIALVSMYSSFF